MGKEFIEYKSENGKMPFSASDLCFCLTQYAKDYINSERDTIADVDVIVRDAVLVDSINYLGIAGGCDFALYTCDLYDDRVHDNELDPQCLLTVFLNYYSCYIFNENIVESVLTNKHMNDCVDNFDVKDGILVLVDFVNYVAKRNDFDKVFELKDFSDRVQALNHEKEMRILKDFLELSSFYSARLSSGECINALYSEILDEHNIKYVSKNGKYYYTDDIKEIVGRETMCGWDKEDFEQDLYALSYAYGKFDRENKPVVNADVINRKVKEMKKIRKK